MTKTKYHYLTLQEYFDADDMGLLQAGDGATLMREGMLLEQLTHIDDPLAVVWVEWDDVERSGMRSYIDRVDAARIGLLYGDIR